MAKRRRSINEDGSEDGRKRVKTDIIEQIFESLLNYKTSDGNKVCDLFLKAPKRRNQADYYEIVKNPIDLSRIQQKVSMGEYEDLEQLTSDITLLVSNTKAYYKDADTAEHLGAVKLFEAFNELKTHALCEKDEFEEMSITSSEVGSVADNAIDLFEEMFTAVMEAESDDGRQISKMFELLPSRSLYPDYYEVTKNPIDLKTIGTKIQEGKYQSLDELDKDFTLLIQNAKDYNIPSSTIARDANTLKRIVTNKKNEIESRKYHQTPKSERLRAKKQTPQKWSALVASLKYDEEEELSSNDDEDEEEEEETNDETNDDTANFSETDETESNPYWLLYNVVMDTSISEPFKKLPSKRLYPDYYEDIANPISLEQVSMRIKNNEYENVSKLMQDLCLIFDNAMSYNIDDSKIYKDAKKLKSILQMKLNEISNLFDNNDEEESKSQVVAFEIGKCSAPRNNRKSSKSMVNAMSQELKNVRKSQNAVDSQLKKRLKVLYKALMDFNEDGVYLIDPFREKPSKKQYPDYYKVIFNPMDMKTIDSKIKNDSYQTESELVKDFRLIFNNCRQYNEDNSLISQSSVKLEKVLDRKLKDIGPSPTPCLRVKKDRVDPSSATQMKIKKLFDAVYDSRDAQGNRLSTEFERLPSKLDYPEYYEVIRNPISLEKIHYRVKKSIYETVEDLLSDIILMTDNACKFNDPDSSIFKDSLAIQQIALQTKIDLNEDTVNGIPDVQVIVQDLLTKLFISVYNHQDEEGRCYIDSMNEVIELNSELKAFNFDIVKKNLNQGRYRRLDRFQQDMFEVFDSIRRFARTDSQAFEDSIEMQQYYITLRSELCKCGKQLVSTAHDFDMTVLSAHIESIRKEKAPFETAEMETKVDSQKFIGGVTGEAQNCDSNSALANEASMPNYQDAKYNVGDFVYVQAFEAHIEPHIMCIEKFIRDPNNGETLIYGNWFYRQSETYHMPGRRFLEKEVFRTDACGSAQMSRILCKCYVMFVKDYFHYKPKGFDDQYVFVCESKYFSKGKTFKKIKLWNLQHTVEIEPRDAPLEMSRVPSVFKDAQQSVQNEVKGEEDKDASFCEDPEPPATILDVVRPNVPCGVPEGITVPEGQYYEQFTIDAGTLRVGDCAYVRTDQERNLICRIDRIWVNEEGTAYFHGPWFVQQAELPPGTSGTFYPQEVFLSSIEDSNPLLSICQRCCVLGTGDFKKKRPTEITEKDVYVCETKYMEHEKRFAPLPVGAMDRLVPFGASTVKDEIYFFKNELFLQKNSYELPFVRENVNQFAGPEGPMMIIGAIRPSMEGLLNEDSNMSALSSGPNSTAGFGDNLPGPGTPTFGTPTQPKIKSKVGKKLVTGYIIFASEVRKAVVERNPDKNFGDISRMVGIQWKQLPQNVKHEYELRAQKHNNEMKDAQERSMKEPIITQPLPAGTYVENYLYDCLWENKCDYQFEDSGDLQEHLIGDVGGHIHITYPGCKDKEDGQFQCHFKGCGRIKKSAPPFPNMTKLIRHIRDVHVNKSTPKFCDPECRKANFVPSSKRPIHEQNAVRMQHQTPQHLKITSGPTFISGQNGHQAIILSNGAIVPTQQVANHVQLQPGQTLVTPTQSQSIHSIGGQPPNIQIQSQLQSAPVSQTIQVPVQQSVSAPVVIKQTAEIGIQFPEIQNFTSPPEKFVSLKHSDVYLRYKQNLKPQSAQISNWPKQLQMLQQRARSDLVHRTDPSIAPDYFDQSGGVSNDYLVKYLWGLRDTMFKDSLKLVSVYEK